MDKKSRIIKAFEELDSDMIDLLLNEHQSYQDVPKKLFIDEITRYFNVIKHDWDNKIDFKAYPGICNNCQKGKKGFSFINSDKECYMSLIFEETEDDYSDIYKCGCFNTFDKEIENEWSGIFFYADDSVDYLPTALNLQEEKDSLEAVEIIEHEVHNEGILCIKFCLEWFERYKYLDEISDIFTGKLYRFKKTVISYLSDLSSIIEMIKKENRAKEFFFEFSAFPVITEETIKDWLIRCDYELRYFKYGFCYDSYFLADYFDTGTLKIDLSPLYFSQSICTILEKYQHWIPDPNPLWEKKIEETDFDKEENFPF